MQYDVIDGEFRVQAWATINTGVTSNCGMATVTGFYTSVTLPPTKEDPWSRRAAVSKEDTTRLSLAHLPAMIEKIEQELPRGLVVISDKMLLSGRPTSVQYDGSLRTSNLIAYLIKERIGTIVTSPLVRNYTYHEGAHDIQAVFWVPPKFEGGIVCQGRALPSKKEAPDKPRAVAYNNWIYPKPLKE